MTQTQRFSYRNLQELQDAISRRNLDLPASSDLSILASPVSFGRLTVPNRFCIQPMEGCDGTADGMPGDLTVRRYNRFAAGGAGMIWFEACAVVPQGRANPRQLWLHDRSAAAFADMLRQARQAARHSMGHEIVCVLQLTHSGRYSRPGPKPAPIIAHHSAVLDPKHNLPADYPLITDDELDALQEDYVRTAVLAAQVGFDAVDIKCCHRYLLSELLASFTRENSRYGGSYENRTRMIRETVAKVHRAVGDRVEVTARMNAFDAIEHPYGWGVSREDKMTPDPAEPIRLVGQLRELGFGGINLTIGNPYFNPHVNRPADWMIANWPEPPEDPLTGVARIVDVVRQVQRAHADMPIVGSGYSWLRQYFPYFAAGAIQRGDVTIAGVGRGALAYPNFAKDIVQGRGMDPHKICVACSSCTQLMRDGQVSGCVVRDAEVYVPIFRRGRLGDAAKIRELASQCRRCNDAMCTAACPAGVDIPAFVGSVADGDDRAAYATLRERNILPAICAAACPVEVQCQGGCIRNQLAGEPVQIAAIQAGLSRRAIAQGWAALELPACTTGKTVAVVGAGPAGLAAAAELLQRGHRVVLFDRSQARGGKAGSVIPTARLAGEMVNEEIAATFAGVPAERLDWKLGQQLGGELTVESLRKQYDAVVLATGLGAGMGLSGERPEGVVEANEFLTAMKAGDAASAPAVRGNRVAVIGGGNTAMDAAVAAARGGASDVYLVYRRSYLQMPAWPAERDAAMHEGIHLMLLCQPREYVRGAAGKVAGLKVVRTELGPADGSGRRKPVEIAGSEFVLSADLVVEAIGERVDPLVVAALAGVDVSREGLVKVDDRTLATSAPGVFAAGDLTNGGATVVQAIAEGNRAAQSAHEFVKKA